MATALQGFHITVRSCLRRSIVPQRASKPSLRARTRGLSTTPLRWNESPTQSVEQALSKLEAAKNPKAQQVLELEKDFEELEIQDSMAKEEDLDEFKRIITRMSPPEPPKKRLKSGFFNDNDPEPWEDEDTLLDDHDDISALGHGELEHHREMRHYARLAAWEMPLLSKMVKPFQPPTTKEPLRFRYTTYMGEQHPAEKKVVLEFCPEDLPDLTEIQRNKLKKLAGVRYNPEKDIVKMSSEMFETQAQNKRYLGDLVEKLLKEARDPTDTFEDIPLDTRHHRVKPRPKFPVEWRLTDQRQIELALYRQRATSKDQKKELTGQLVNGIALIEEGLARMNKKAALPEMALIGKGAPTSTKGKRVVVKR